MAWKPSMKNTEMKFPMNNSNSYQLKNSSMDENANSIHKSQNHFTFEKNEPHNSGARYHRVAT